MPACRPKPELLQTPTIECPQMQLFLRSGDALVHDDCLVLTPCDNSKRGAAVYHKLFTNDGEIKVRFQYKMEVRNL